MYNHYLDDNNFVALDPEPQAPSGPRPLRSVPAPNRPSQSHPEQPYSHQSRSIGPIHSKNDLIGEITGGLGQLLSGVRKHFALENFDTGDILLVLIILFLYLEGDNLELVITLGLLLLLGLDDSDPADDKGG